MPRIRVQGPGRVRQPCDRDRPGRHGPGDPATGTFLSPDLLDGVEGTTTIANTYHYANNDPLNQSDPTGLRPGETGCQGFLASVICEHSELIITTASITVGFACGMAGMAVAGPFAAGAAGAACGGAVHRGLTAYTAGEKPWAAALNPQLLIRDAAIGGVTEWGMFRLAKLAAPLVGTAMSRARSAVLRVSSAGTKSPGQARGINEFGGVIEQTATNAAGGRIFTSTGTTMQKDFDGIVTGALMRGDDVKILTGAHGFPDGSTIPHPQFYADDIAQYGELPGVTVHNLPAMTPVEVRDVLRGPGTIIGGICNSGACLAPYM